MLQPAKPRRAAPTPKRLFGPCPFALYDRQQPRPCSFAQTLLFAPRSPRLPTPLARAANLT